MADSIFFDDSDDPGWVEFRERNRKSGVFVSGPWEPDPAFVKPAVPADDAADVAELISEKIDKMARQGNLAPLSTPGAVGWPEFWRQLEQRIDDAGLRGLVKYDPAGIGGEVGAASQTIRNYRSEWEKTKRRR